MALRTSGRGAGLILDPAIAARLAGRDDRRLGPDAAHTLTARQLEIVQGLAAAKSMRQIATGLGITVKTVENQATRIYAALGAANRHEAVQRARDLGLVGG
jgi:DNA-binding NarL/FixJ family response regulator